uniref:T-complex protein 1 subunit theta n=2 Tax=Ornithodoros turicata TaxID=34597 RepID=A0A2R5LMR1_9ACAR
MSLRGPSLSNFLKEGSRHYQGVEEAVFRCIEACGQLARTVSSAYGPNGLNKMVINHLEKLFVTNDASTVISQLDVQHPAAKLLVMASQMQEKEVGDGTNFVVMFAGALLGNSEDLIRTGLTPVEVVEGYELALKKTLEILPNLTAYEIKDTHHDVQVMKGVRTAIMSKQLGQEDFLADLVVKACISIYPEKSASFNVDNVRVCKILGSGVEKSCVIQGMVFKRQIEGDVTKAKDAKVAVYTCAVDSMQTETKGTVLIKTASELRNFSRGEENLLESQIKAIADAGAKVVVSGGKIGDMALHYLNKYGIMAVRLMSKFDVRRVCRVVGATPLPKLTAPTPEDLGLCDSVYVDEIGETPVIVFRQEGQESRIATIVVRGSTDSLMDDIERAIDDGVNAFKAITRDGRLVPGAGATEMELACEVTSYAETLPGLEQYAVKKFAEALECVPKALVENAGVGRPMDVLSKLYAAHNEGKKYFGFDIEPEQVSGGTKDAVEAGVLDLYLTKFWGLQYATRAATTVLKVDQIIMSKPAGGPKAPKQAGGDWDEDK